MQKSKYRLEACFSPALYPYRQIEDAFNLVVIDVLRATTSICAAFQNGVESIIPVATIEEAKEYKRKGYLVASERDGQVLDFADFGNSAFNFMQDGLQGVEIVYSTTNGTQAMQLAPENGKMVIGAFSNLTALKDWLINQKRDVLFLCSGWKNKFNIEDTLLVGALAELILAEDIDFYSQCDSVMAAIDLWKAAKPDVLGYIEKAAHRHRLKKLGLDDVLEFSFTVDTCPVVPVLEGERLVKIR